MPKMGYTRLWIPTVFNKMKTIPLILGEILFYPEYGEEFLGIEYIATPCHGVPRRLMGEPHMGYKNMTHTKF